MAKSAKGKEWPTDLQLNFIKAGLFLLAITAIVGLIINLVNPDFSLLPKSKTESPKEEAREPAEFFPEASEAARTLNRVKELFTEVLEGEEASPSAESAAEASPSAESPEAPTCPTCGD